jgi:hypothetical protein
MTLLGEHLLGALPAMLKVSVSGAPEPVGPQAPTLYLFATYRR